MSAKFYICRHCGNLVGMIHDAGVPMMCCGQKMEALEPNTVEASSEKHLPAVTVEDGAIHVNVGSVDHPMLPEHFIVFGIDLGNGNMKQTAMMYFG